MACVLFSLGLPIVVRGCLLISAFAILLSSTIINWAEFGLLIGSIANIESINLCSLNETLGESAGMGALAGTP